MKGRLDRKYQRIASFFLVIMGLEIILPTTALALTGGPSQPEFEAFEPVGTDQMVDLFSGDFSYNIPLLTVPGPNGGYPINLAYHSGIGMEQEASWVGLGWNVNVGEITRQMRGLPDDFNGDLVKREFGMKPNVTVAAKFASGRTENMGVGTPPPNTYSVYYNNYAGVGLGFEGSVIPESKKNGSKRSWFEQSGLFPTNLAFDSQNGLEFSRSIGFPGLGENKFFQAHLAARFSSRHGLESMDLKAATQTNIHTGQSHRYQFMAQWAGMNGWKQLSGSGGAGMSSATPSYVPGSFAPFRGTTANLGFGIGPMGGSVPIPLPPTRWTESIGLFGSYSKQIIHPDYRSKDYPAYGYLYTQNASAGERLIDLNRDKDVPVTRRNQVAPMPMYTHDQFFIKGQGVGGAFRPFRSDVGILSQQQVTSKSRGGSLALEIGTPPATNPPLIPPWHVGVNPSYSTSRSHQGTWQHGLAAIQTSSGTNLDAKSRTTTDPLFEPAYFKMNGEQTAASPTKYSDINGAQPLRFDLGLASGAGFALAPKLKNDIGTGSPYPISSTANKEDTRQLRNTNIQFRTVQEIIADQCCQSGASIQDMIYVKNEMPIDPGSNPQPLTYAGRSESHIAEITVLNDGGDRYVYGLPAYITDHKDVSYAHEDISATSPVPRIVDNTTNDFFSSNNGANVKENGNGEDNWYSNVDIPEYAHSHLLTAVYSPDYVDVLDDGPTVDDLGYFVKFNYTQPISYNWRSPIQGAYFNTNYRSNEHDDKASYSYGSRDQYYLHSVETKTHIALFHLSDRDDSRGAEDVDNDDPTGGGAYSQQLDTIKLVSRKDPSTVLKKVVFTYSNKLCPGAINSANNSGKLTLDQVVIKHLNSEKGSLNPYKFEYFDADPISTSINEPSYDEKRMDRWGNVADPADPYDMSENPFVDQTIDDPNRNSRASSWCLERIHLPSGGTIEVDYEADDYAFVQDKVAGQMCRIKGTQESTESPDSEIKADFLKIYFSLDRTMDNSVQADIDEFNEYVNGLDEVYFKTWQKLKNYPGTVNDAAFDYVTGYAKVDHSAGSSGIDPNNNQQGFITVEQASYGLGGVKPVHPFRKAGWQYLRYQRPDLIYDQNTGVLGNVAQMIPTIISSIPRLLGWYSYADISGYCNELELDANSPPSFLRLNTPDGIKYGGGNRVSEVRLKDNWTEGSQEFGKQYTYRTTDDDGRIISSGVAAYEPLIGGEEISLRKPIWYNGDDAMISFNHRDAFVEEPLGESYYPGASVGYSRVVVTDLQEAQYASTMNGSTVHEFHTAKDFPVAVKRTELESKRFAPPDIYVPFVGMATFNNHGYSMGYAVHLNDMHGKVKSVATYRYGMEDQQEPVSRTSYVYHTDPSQPSGLNNKVDVLYDHFDVQEAVVGRSMDFFLEAREHSTKSENYGLNFNVQSPPYPFWLMIEPQMVRAESLFRSIVSNKVILSNGLLKQVVTEVDGARNVSTNLLYDAHSGQPLLTSVNNAWEDPVFTYKYAAHMAYDGMANASTNWGAEVAVTGSGGTYQLNPSSLDAEEIFQLGDEVVDGSGEHYWVNNVVGATIGLEDKYASVPSSLTNPLKILRSGHRNQQSVTNGTIVSLEDPVNVQFCGREAIADFINEHIFQNQQYNGLTTISMLPIPSCYYSPFTPYWEILSGPVTANGNCLNGGGILTPSNQGDFIGYYMTIGSCEYQLLINYGGIGGGIPLPDINEIEFIDFGAFICTSQAQIPLDARHVTLRVNGALVQGYWMQHADEFEKDCFKKTRTLHADATEFKDDWAYDYIDAGISNLTGSDYHDGRKGIWRPLRRHLYQVDRLNYEGGHTDPRYDGEYAAFTYYDFLDPLLNGDEWVNREQMNRYSPFGFSLESENSIGIRSSELYGYSNSLVTASANNCGYYELAYDGFDDHDGLTYSNGHGHLSLTGSSALSNSYAHTGTKSMVIPDGGLVAAMNIPYSPSPSTFQNWNPIAGKRYVVSAWFRTTDRSEEPIIEILDNGVLLAPDNVIADQVPIDGWRKVDVEFTPPMGQTGILQINFDVIGQTGSAYLDDVRIHPAEGSCVTYSYDPDQYWLRATLNDQNYATLYNYDEEGTLTQVNQETENGLVTLKSTRQHIARQP